VRRALGACRLLVLDVDGVLTDGRVIYVGGEEAQAFDVRDGQGLVWLARAGVEVAWISGRGCAATEKRASELGVRALRLRVSDKGAALSRLQEERAIQPAETVAMGDDLADFALAARAALFAAPADAHELVREHASIVTAAKGGRGAVRELCEAILRAKDRWSEIVAEHA
jgi:3-deoxy-D-manno-octulosonate 8-phosphate phosphatase (KDO 8-P phosphatase)